MIRLAAARMLGARPTGRVLSAVVLSGGVLGVNLLSMGLLGGGKLGGGEVAVHEVDAGEVASWLLGTREQAARVLAALMRVGFVRVLAGRQEAEPGLEGHGTGQFEVRPLGENLELVDGQGDTDLAAPGVDAGQPPGADPRHQPGDLEDGMLTAGCWTVLTRCGARPTSSLLPGVASVRRAAE